MPVPAMANSNSAHKTTNVSLTHTHNSDSDVLRIAVTNSVPTSSAISSQNYFMHLAKETPLTTVIEELCQHWGFIDPENYGLIFDSTKEYVTDRNKDKIQNGTILKLCHSPKKYISEVLHTLRVSKDPVMRQNTLKILEKVSSDHALSSEIVAQDGLNLIIFGICDPTTTSNNMAHLVCSFHEIMKYEDLVDWDDPRIGSDLITQIGSLIEPDASLRALTQDEKVQQCCLAVLESLAYTPSKFNATEKVVSIKSILNFLESSNDGIQQNALALFNAIFRAADRNKKIHMNQDFDKLGIRRMIVENIIQKKPGKDMCQTLYTLQCLRLNLLEEKMLNKGDFLKKAVDNIKELQRIAFDLKDSTGYTVKRKIRFEEEYRKLGFKNVIDPVKDFDETPPGMLALDLMYFFATHHTEQFTKLVLESSCRNDNNGFPFAKVSVEVVKLMCQILRIGAPLEENGNFLPMFFIIDHPLEEMFAVTILHVNRTWREMRATHEDFDKVIDVANEQISDAVKRTPKSIDEYRKSLRSYSDISESRKEEAKSRGEKEGKAVQHLRELIKPDIITLVQRQRLKFLTKGTRFNKYKREGGKERGKYIFCRLNNNHKSFHYGECSGNENLESPSLDMLTEKLPVSEIKDFITGSACPHIRSGDTYRRNRDKANIESLAFSFIKENGDTVDFIAPDEKTFDYWCDGVNALLRREMKSGKAMEDLEMILTMEVKIRLLDVEGINIPDEAPPVPPLPQNINFSQTV